MERRPEDELFEYLRRIIYEEDAGTIQVESLPTEWQDMGQGLSQLAVWMKEYKAFATALAEGEIDTPAPNRDNIIASPIKALQATMNHIAWQANQVTKGDYTQRIDFMGELADAFNEMTKQLREKTVALQESRDHALQSRNLFKSILDRLDRYVVTVHNETGEPLYANVRARDLANEDSELSRTLVDMAISRKISRKQGERTEEVEVKVPNAEDRMGTRYFTLESRYLQWEEQPATIHIIQDITNQRRAAEEMETLAFVDEMTGLHNRQYIMPIVEQWLEQGYHFSLAFIDLDHLKQANDEYGHDEGDRYIQAAAAMMNTLPGEKELARVGGDEFLLLMRGRDREETEALLEEKRTELMEGRDGRYAYEKAYSYGVVEVDPKAGNHRSDILREADRRMYQYKIAYKSKFSGRDA